MSNIDDFEKRRAELYTLNSKAWDGEDVFKTKGKLDTSLKKNTAFIKKARTGITKENEKQFIDGIQTTSLEKYLNEISSALCESLCKVSKNADLPSCVEVVSALHQRFTSKFTPFMELFFVHSFTHPTEKLLKKDEKETIIKIRNLLKLSMEFFLAGMFRSINDMPESDLPPYLSKLKAIKKDSIPIIIPIVKQIMSYDFESGITLSIMTSFLKRFGNLIYEQNPRYEENYCIFLRKLFKSYIQNAVSSTETYYKSIVKTKATSKTIAMKTGKIVENMESKIDELELVFEEFKTFCEYACPLSDIPLPTLEVEIEKEESSKVTIVQQSSNKNQIWDNDEMRKFYEDIPSLESLVSKEALDSVNAKIQASDIKGSKIADIILRLDTTETAKDIDLIVTDFWEWGLSNKASRNRLSKHIVELKDVNKFKNIARFLKINVAYFEKCIEDLITRLDKSFRFQIHHDTIAEKDVIIFSELIKFKMIPIHVIFHKIRTLILNIEVNNNIDLLSLMFDGCSKSLLYDDEYKDYTKELIQLLIQAYKTKKFTHTDKYAVKVFLLSLNPPKPKKQNKVELLKEEKFLMYLIKSQLNNNTHKLIANMIKCADWTNPVIYERIEDILSKPSEINYINIRCLAEVLKSLTLDSNDSLRTRVIDQVIEDIIVGLEENKYEQLRMRISHCIYFIQMINLNIINKDYLIPMLYKILCFGHANNYPSRDNICEFDEPTDRFRIRLISLMLTNLQVDRLNKSRISKLITFIKFFNYYIFTKNQPLSIDLDNDINEAYKKINGYLKNKVTRLFTYGEALSELQMELSQGTSPTSTATLSTTPEDEDDVEEVEDESEDDGVDEDELVDGDVNKAIGLEIVSDSDDDDDKDETDDEDDSDDDSDDTDGESDDDSDEDSEDGDLSEVEEGNIAIVSDDDNEETGDEDPSQAFHEAELDIEFKKILDASLQNNSGMSLKGDLSDRIGTPESIMYKLKKNNNDEGYVETEQRNTQNKGVKFTLLSKNGRKLKPRDIVLPENSKIAVNVVREQERIREEKDKIKNFVLNSVQ